MEAWTDNRLDDLAATLRPLPQEVARIGGAVEGLTEETRSMREDMRSMRADMRSMREDIRSVGDDMRSMREDQSAFQRQLAQIGWSLAGALAAAMFALVIALI